MRKIDIETWDRKSHYEWFSSFADPTFAMDVKMDITGVLEYCKERNLSSYAVVMYAICACINASPAFRLRALDGGVVEIDSANVAYTIMTNDNTFVNCRATMKEGFPAYLAAVEANREKYNNKNFVQKQFNNVVIVDDIYCSCVPWVTFLSAKQPIPDKSDENRSIPRACWGKYFQENGRTYMILNITANHALADGKDMSMVFLAIQKAFDNIEEFLTR